MQLYDIRREDLLKYIDHPLFKQGIELAVEENFFLIRISFMEVMRI